MPPPRDVDVPPQDLAELIEALEEVSGMGVVIESYEDDWGAGGGGARRGKQGPGSGQRRPQGPSGAGRRRRR